MKKKITGDKIKTEIGKWTFEGNVSNTFDSHIKKSIPLYEWCHEIGTNLSDFFLKDNTACYDIGCSTGTFIKNLSDRNKYKKKIKFYGIDEVNPMIKKAKKKCKNNRDIIFLNKNFLNLKLKKSSFISSYFTIAFVEPSQRQKAFNNFYKSLEWGGGLIVFDKVRAPDARFQDMMTTIYNEYKITAGYSADEILNKTLSLKGILDPFSSRANQQMLKRAGFTDVMTVFKFITFEGYLAIK
tara:strand:- start:527 stop:1246 length:720 start_codon:yes stop_codon:yes gene_type:complete